MVTLSSLFQQYGFSTVVSDGIEILYSYNVVDPLVSSIDVGYSYNDDADDDTNILYGSKTAATQQILNNLPPWMEMRKNYNSNGNQLVSAWAQNLESVLDLYNTYRKDEFISTADVYYNINLAVSDLVGGRDKLYTPTFRNLLFNSSFSMLAPKRLQRPLGWTVSRDSFDALQLTSNGSLFGNHALILDGTVASTQLSQTRLRALPASPLTLSIFVKTLEDTGLDSDETWSSPEAGLLLAVWNADNSLSTYGVGFPKNTSGKWTRASLTVNLTTEIYKVTVIILNRQACRYVVDCPMLEQAATLNEWTPNLEDVTITSSAESRSVAGVQVLFQSLDGSPVNKIEVLPTATEEEFKGFLVPTRIEQFYPDKDSLNSYSLTYGRQINYFEEIMPTSWTAVNSYIQEKSVTNPDIFSNRKPADVSMNEDGDLYLDTSLIDNNNTLVKAVCVVDNLLYTVTQETYAETTGYYLKFVQPKVIDYTNNYMPSLGDIKLPITLGTSFGIEALDEDINRIGICKNIPNAIFVDTTLDRRFYFKLYFDYYFPDFTSRRIFCRENYSKQNGFLQVL